jgi:hypothetical protein
VKANIFHRYSKTFPETTYGYYETRELILKSEPYFSTYTSATYSRSGLKEMSLRLLVYDRDDFENVMSKMLIN